MPSSMGFSITHLSCEGAYQMKLLLEIRLAGGTEAFLKPLGFGRDP